MTERIVRIAARPLLRKLVTPLEADDLYQVGRLALWRHGQGKPEPDQVTIARSAMLDEIRRHRWVSRSAYGDGAAWEMSSYDGWASVPEGMTDCHAASIIAVRQCIANMHSLTERKRQVLRCLVAGMQKQEVAAECGVSPARITQIVAELRERVERDLI